ncbi:MAG: class I SAM-dependent methyltransferase [Acidimicrobiales bacterium]
MNTAATGSGAGWGGPVANVEQAQAWDGAEGDHWVRNQQRYEAMTGAFTERLLSAAAIEAADRTLDIGCGNGQTTRLAARRAGRGLALGVDLSAAMLDCARRDAADEGLTNVRFERADAQVHAFPPAAFDVAVSRFGVMFFDDPVAAFTNICRALQPGGRLAFLCWQEALRNDYVAVPLGAALAHVPVPDVGGPDAPGPFSLADPGRIDEVLTDAGFEQITTASVEAQMRLGDEADDAVEFLGGTGLARALLESVEPAAATRALDAVRDALRPYEQADGVHLGGAAWLVTAHRSGITDRET